MRLTKMFCDGCGRKPTFGEWVKGEITMAGYPDWRHPGIPFKEAGVPMLLEKRDVWVEGWEKLFGQAPPDDLNFLCPECQTRVDLELPDMIPGLETAAEAKRAAVQAATAQRVDEKRSYFGSAEDEEEA